MHQFSAVTSLNSLLGVVDSPVISALKAGSSDCSQAKKCRVHQSSIWNDRKCKLPKWVPVSNHDSGHFFFHLLDSRSICFSYQGHHIPYNNHWCKTYTTSWKIVPQPSLVTAIVVFCYCWVECFINGNFCVYNTKSSIPLLIFFNPLYQLMRKHYWNLKL